MSSFFYKKQEIPQAGEGENMPRRYNTIEPILSDRANRSKYTFYDEKDNKLGQIEDIAHMAAPGVGTEKTYHFSNARDRTFNDMSPLYVKGPALKVPPNYGGKKSRRGGKRRGTRRTRNGRRKSRRTRRR
jgi:hypothetical protein